MGKLKEFYVVSKSPDGEYERRYTISALDKEHAKELVNNRNREIAEAEAGTNAASASEEDFYGYVADHQYVIESATEVK